MAVNNVVNRAANVALAAVAPRCNLILLFDMMARCQIFSVTEASGWSVTQAHSLCKASPVVAVVHVEPTVCWLVCSA